MIRFGTIVYFVNQEVGGKFGAKIAYVNIEKQPVQLRCYVKQLNSNELLIEIFSALIGQKLGLPIPEPIISFDDQNNPWYSSLDVKYLDLSKRLGLDNNQLINSQSNIKIFQKLANWKNINLACVFDEYIANEDRNLGNILFNGNDKFYLIDHHLSMAPKFANNSSTNNELQNINLHFNGQHEIDKQRIKATFKKESEAITDQLPTEIANKLTANPIFQDPQLDMLVNFLNTRCKFLSTIVEQQIQTEQQQLPL